MCWPTPQFPSPPLSQLFYKRVAIAPIWLPFPRPKDETTLSPEQKQLIERDYFDCLSGAGQAVAAKADADLAKRVGVQAGPVPKDWETMAPISMYGNGLLPLVTLPAVRVCLVLCVIRMWDQSGQSHGRSR